MKVGRKQPMQDVNWCPRDNKTVRFHENAIVRAVLDASTDGRKMSLNDIAGMDFCVEDREQFVQLIGYSISGFGELSYVRNSTYDEAATKVDALIAKRARARRERGGAR